MDRRGLLWYSSVRHGPAGIGVVRLAGIGTARFGEVW